MQSTGALDCIYVYAILSLVSLLKTMTLPLLRYGDIQSHTGDYKIICSVELCKYVRIK